MRWPFGAERSASGRLAGADKLPRSETQSFVYPEWDFRARDYRPDWCQVRQQTLDEGTLEFYERTLQTHAGLVSSVRKQFEMLRPELLRRRKRLIHGDDLDLDATIDHFVDRRAHRSPTEKVYWRKNKDEGRASVLCGYALGKAQRLLAGLDPSIGPILGHGAILRLLPAYRASGISFPEIVYAGLDQAKSTRGWALVIAPPSAAGSPWIKKFGPVSLAMASGWMQIRGLRRRKGLDRGFVLSDHADWNGLNEAIMATGAERIWLTHGSTGK